MIEFIGRFHPLFVHLPIGVLLLAAVFQLLSQRQNNKSLQLAAGIALFWGMWSAIASCITGYLLSQSGDYDDDLVSTHQWFGIGVAVISIVAYYLNKKQSRSLTWVMALVVIGIAVTGHLGGSLTHGEGYLSKGFSSSEDADNGTPVKPIANAQEAIAYNDIVQPILKSRCYNCHGSGKQKGKLRMDEIALFMKGGKHGKIVKPGKADESELVKRLLLPRQEEEHMPPKEKPQPTVAEIQLLQWWINAGASFDKKVNQLAQPEKIKPVLLALQNPGTLAPEAVSWIPEVAVARADDASLKKLRDAGIAVVPVARNSNYLSASFVAAAGVDEAGWKLLASLKDQLIELRAGSPGFSDADLIRLAAFTSLRKLHLANAPITNDGLAKLKTLVHLQYLNLVNTKITAPGLMQLTELKQLSAIYLYKTGVGNADWASLQKAFPKAIIDSGGYVVQMLPGDTTELTKPVEKKN